MQPVLLGPALQVDVVRRRLGVRRTPRAGPGAGPRRGRPTRSTQSPPGRSALADEREAARCRTARRWRRGRGSRGRCRRRAGPGRTPPGLPPRSRRGRRPPTTSTRSSARRAGPWGTVPSRSHPTSAGSISATTTRRTRSSASTSASVKPRPRPPTSTRSGRSWRASASRASARSLDVSRVSITNTPLARSSSVVLPSSSVRWRSTSSPRSDSARATSTSLILADPGRTSYELVAIATTSYDVVGRLGAFSTGRDGRGVRDCGSGQARGMTHSHPRRAEDRRESRRRGLAHPAVRRRSHPRAGASAGPRPALAPCRFAVPGSHHRTTHARRSALGRGLRGWPAWVPRRRSCSRSGWLEALRGTPYTCVRAPRCPSSAGPRPRHPADSSMGAG